jgi:para-nitrobenzyl esterase
MSAYVAFARTGSPNHSRMPQWKPYEIETRPTMVFDENPRLVDDFHSGDRRASDELPEQGTFQVLSGPLFRYDS